MCFVSNCESYRMEMICRRSFSARVNAKVIRGIADESLEKTADIHLAIGYSLDNSASPIRARSVTALTSIGEVFSDSGRSSRMPSLRANARKRMSTS